MLEGHSSNEKLPGVVSFQTPIASLGYDDIDYLLQIGVDGSANLKQWNGTVECIEFEILA